MGQVEIVRLDSHTGGKSPSVWVIAIDTSVPECQIKRATLIEWQAFTDRSATRRNEQSSTASNFRPAVLATATLHGF